jgi:electron transport complex protein RnfB
LNGFWISWKKAWTELLFPERQGRFYTGGVMMKDVYELLREKLDKFPIGMPDSVEAIEILKIYYSPEEAELALKLPMLNKSLEDLAAELDEDIDALQQKLDRMAAKGTVYAAEKNGKRIYRMLPSVEGFSEAPFWPGKKDETFLKLAPLWRKYFDGKFAREIGDRKTSMMRVIPLDTTISNESQVTPYEDLEKLLEQNAYFAVAYCPCRQIVKETGGGCDHLLEACFHFDSMGKYMVEHNMAREISREETMDILKKCNEEGLVHATYNNQGKVNTICNCCSCCCIFFRTLKEHNLPGALARSNYVSRIDPDLCSACETCSERCPVDAITIDDAAEVDEDRCVGCGVCVPSCPTEAIVLVRRKAEQVHEILDSQTWLLNTLREKGTI